MPWLRALCLITAFSLLLVFSSCASSSDGAETDLPSSAERDASGSADNPSISSDETGPATEITEAATDVSFSSEAQTDVIHNEASPLVTETDLTETPVPETTPEITETDPPVTTKEKKPDKTTAPETSADPVVTTSDPVTEETSSLPEPVFMPVVSELPENSSEMSKDLALRLIGLCSDGSKSGTAAKLREISFDVIMTGNYDKSDGDRSHTSAYTFAKHGADDGNCYLIVIRGTNAGEWYSNFDFAPSHGNGAKYAENFYLAASDIFRAIVPTLDSDPGCRIVVCGHSRGASTANLLGVMLDDRFGEENVYVYTYATPNTVRELPDGKEYGNIFNFINENDVVTHLPPVEYGFSRAGTDVILSGVSSEKQVISFFSSLCNYAPDIDSYYNVKYSLQDSGFDENGMSMYDVMCVFAGFLAGGELDVPTDGFSWEMLRSDLLPVFLKMTAAFSSAGTDIVTEHEASRYESLINAMR